MSYPPVYIINLKRATERKLNIQKQLDALNLNYRFIEAVDKRNLDSKVGRAAIARQLDIPESQIETLHRTFIPILEQNSASLGHLGCLLSHIKVYNLMIKHNIPKACVLEDDAYLLPVFPKILVAAQKVPWDVLMLFHCSPSVAKITFQLSTRKKFDKKSRLSLFRLCRYFYRLVCYKKYFPHLSPYTVRWIISATVKYLVLKVPAKLFNIKNTRYYLDLINEIGALPVPDRSTWHKTIPNYYIARSYNSRDNHIPTTAAYMLTKSAAIKLRNEGLIPRKPLSIDAIITKLSSTSLDRCLSIPPCAKLTNTSTRSTRHD